MENKKIREIVSLDEMDKKDVEELERIQTEDILERYDNEEYYDPEIVDNFLQDKGYKLVDL